MQRLLKEMSKLLVGRVFLSHTFLKNKVWTKLFRVVKSDIFVHINKSPLRQGGMEKLKNWFKNSNGGRCWKKNQLIRQLKFFIRSFLTRWMNFGLKKQENHYPRMVTIIHLSPGAIQPAVHTIHIRLGRPST